MLEALLHSEEKEKRLKLYKTNLKAFKLVNPDSVLPLMNLAEAAILGRQWPKVPSS